MSSKLDDFSWDILHSIFDYLNPFDLLNGFVHINTHFDRILNAYRCIRIDFKEIQKSIFISICERIQLTQIQSLRLSNDVSTPGQIQLFMSLIPLIQCSNLQYLHIEHINDVNLLSLIYSHLEDHKHICSLTITDSSLRIRKTNARHIAKSLATLSLLTHLTITNSSTLILLQEPLVKLTHLTIELCQLSDLKIIFLKVPNLIYLHISIPSNDLAVRFDYIPEQLKSLIIESKAWISFEDIENIFSLTPYLKYFTLDTFGEQTLLNGHRWESLIKSKLPYLKELRFNINPEENQITGDEVLTSFQSSFWTIEKHWNMACLISTSDRTCARLFSVPYFAPTSDWCPSSEGFSNYSLASFPFHDYFKHLHISYIPNDDQVVSTWKSIEILTTYYSIDDVEQLEKIVNLSTIKHLILNNFRQGPGFSNILQALHNLNQLTIMGKASKNVCEVLADVACTYNHIKKLFVQNVIVSLEDIDIIGRIFPKLEYIKLSMKNQADIRRVFEKLNHLNSATFDWTHPLKVLSEQIDNFLQENDICTDGAYTYASNSLSVWIS